ncbi:NACHT, LRR and PYD domains-containing 12 [Paramuricea clavata]|uniref:NACHT, LRR and PYD domains-containing 12 n=1 Tax=Paramuricea clavata TaxID=317549 RepID=A0A7D9EUD5_PARCT|nr:NACHT, LRR and PYD domains-containing 12 [Paramuricea clavata]
MSDATVSSENVKLLINGNLPSNMLSYVAEQAVSGDQVMYCMAIHNSVLLQWYNSKSKQKYVDFLNEIIPNGSIKVKRTSSRIEDRLRYQCSQVSQQIKKLNLKGSKAKRVTFLNNMSKVSILASDVATAAEMEQEIQRFKIALQEMHVRLDNLNVELEEWKKQFHNLEKEKELLFNEMRNQKDLEISNVVHENEEMRKYVRKLEKKSEDNCSSVIKNIGDLSKWQQKRRMQALCTRAQKALWFAKHFGLKLERLEFLDSNGQKYGWSTSSSLGANISSFPRNTINSRNHTSI